MFNSSVNVARPFVAAVPVYPSAKYAVVGLAKFAGSVAVGIPAGVAVAVFEITGVLVGTTGVVVGDAVCVGVGVAVSVEVAVAVAVVVLVGVAVSAAAYCSACAAKAGR
jgi:hypothetical protein